MNGIVIDIDPVAVHLGAFALRWYGLTFAGGILLGAWIATGEARRRGLDPDAIGGVAMWGIVGGIVGARLFHVVDRLDTYIVHPMQVIMLQEGGLAIWGGIVGGGFAALVAARRARLPLARTADVAAIALPLGQIVGRLGCVVNGDSQGGVTTLPWGFVYVNPASMVPPDLLGVPTHPYPVYEMFWLAALFGLLLLLRRRSLPAGMLFVVYGVGYALGRFVLSFVRQERAVLGDLQQAQVVALAVLVAGLASALWILRARPAAALPSQAVAVPERR